MTICPVCNSDNTRHLYLTNELPVSITSASYDPDVSSHLDRRCADLRSCRMCKHVYNSSYDPRLADYSGKGCRMYNHGITWRQRVKDLQTYISNQKYDLIVEIGPGNGEFLNDVSAERKIVFEPSEDSERCNELGFEVIQEYYNAESVIAQGKTLYLMRHVLEHIEYPGDFIERFTLAARDRPIEMIVEVPCVTNAIQHFRLEDWTYEHAQHFTFPSLKRLFVRAGWTIQRLETQYNNEVLVCHAKYLQPASEKLLDNMLSVFTVSHEQSIDDARAFIKKMRILNKDIVFWGGLGKSSLFLNQLVPNARDLYVVDSDPAKVGLCVPGTPHKIHYAGELDGRTVDIIIITTSWRKDDILVEIARRGIKADQILVYQDGSFVEAEYET